MVVPACLRRAQPSEVSIECWTGIFAVVQHRHVLKGCSTSVFSRGNAHRRFQGVLYQEGCGVLRFLVLKFQWFSSITMPFTYFGPLKTSIRTQHSLITLWPNQLRQYLISYIGDVERRPVPPTYNTRCGSSEFESLRIGANVHLPLERERGSSSHTGWADQSYHKTLSHSKSEVFVLQMKYCKTFIEFSHFLN